MRREIIEKITRGVGKAIQQGAAKSGRHNEQVLESIEAVGKQIEDQEKRFEAKKERVRKKLNSGARRTHGDPV